MSVKDDIKSYIRKSGWTLTRIAEELSNKNGTKITVQNLSKKINNETLRYSEVLEIAEVIGYKLKWEEVEQDFEITSTSPNLEVINNKKNESASDLFNGVLNLNSKIQSEFIEEYKKQFQENLFKAFIESYVVTDERKK